MDRAQIAALIGKNGLRPTAQRVAVYEYLLRRTHPSVDEVFTAVSRDDPSLSRTTVYNSLHALVEAGLVLELSLAGTQERHYDAASPSPRRHSSIPGTMPYQTALQCR